MTQLLTLFIVLNIVNVIIQTIKSIVTVKCGKTVASVVNALAYGLYTVVTVYTMCDLPLMTKALVVAVCNLIGVYVVKLFEEKARKEKLWKIEMTIPTQYTTAVDLDLAEIPHNYIKLSDKHTLFNFYCATQKETIKVKEIVNQYGAKYFISETKNF
jgi:uncharacterized protein YebE (UPF0316 family)